MDRFHQFQKAQVNSMRYSIIGAVSGVIVALLMKEKDPADFLAYTIMGYTAGVVTGDFINYKKLKKVIVIEEANGAK
jgi:uncharacterized membrane protein YeaQ/YmgE (transglycosylase-associated protein family)